MQGWIIWVAIATCHDTPSAFAAPWDQDVIAAIYRLSEAKLVRSFSVRFNHPKDFTDRQNMSKIPATLQEVLLAEVLGLASHLRYQKDHQIDDIYWVLPGPFWVSNNDTFNKPLKNWKTGLRFLADHHCWWTCKVSAHWKACKRGQGSNIQWRAKNWFASQQDRHEKISNRNLNNSSNMFVVLTCFLCYQNGRWFWQTQTLVAWDNSAVASWKSF